MSSPNPERKFVQLRPTSKNAEQVAKALEQHGYRQVPSPRNSGSYPSHQSQVLPASSQNKTPLQRAIQDFQHHENPTYRQLALKHITNHATNPANQAEIVSAGLIPILVDTLSSSDEVNQKLALMTLSNLARSGTTQMFPNYKLSISHISF
jgi:hypothetical protein